MIEHKDVQKAFDVLMAANAAEPYVHDTYMRADRELMKLNVSYYGDLHADFAREVQLDCGEVWTVEKLIEYKTAELRSELDYEVDLLAWATDEDYVESKSREVEAVAKKLRDIDARYDVGRWIDEAMVKALREKAETGAGVVFYLAFDAMVDASV
jgi:hypothetical protein